MGLRRVERIADGRRHWGRRPDFPNARRALLTAYADTDAAIAAINRSQVDYYLQKPWDPPAQHLYPVVEELLDDWRSQYRPGYGGVKVIGSRFAPSVHQVKEFLTRNHVPYEFFDVEATDERGDEARTLARFDHPNIVRVQSVFEANGTAYMVMRFEQGENLGTLLDRRGKLGQDELLRVLGGHTPSYVQAALDRAARGDFSAEV